MNSKKEPAIPNLITKRYGFGKDFGWVELNSDGTVVFHSLIEDVHGPHDWGVEIKRGHVPTLRAIIEHLERGGFEEDAPR